MSRLVILPICMSLMCLAACDPSGGASDAAGDSDAVAQTDATPDSDATPDVDAAPDVDALADTAVPACPLAANTTVTTTISASGCVLLERDTGACRAAREAAGLDGFWLRFSCRVSLAVVAGGAVVRATADGQPDYPSMYFTADDPCYEAWPAGAPNPNHIVAVTRAIDFPAAPAAGAQAMGGGVVGIAVNGVPLFANTAAPGDDIFAEAETFDRCGAHPQQTGTYHYHGEPLAISSDDSRLIGVLRDGYPVYGRRDADGSLPSLDAEGGHTATTPDSPALPVYHYHLNQQESAAAGTAGERQWFLTTGSYHGTPAACGNACR